MPIYGYQCDQCGHQLEVLQRFSDPPVHACPECMGPMQKLLYPAGVIFKGSGYYTTDYRSSNSSSTSTSTSSDSKPDSKPADSTTTAKSDTKAAS